MTRFPVFHSPLSLSHDPPHEILSGCVQPYFESPERYHRILDAVLKDGDTYEEFKMIWKAGEVDTEELREAIRRVHDEDYLAFLREIYDEWVAEGGSKVCEFCVGTTSGELTAVVRRQEAVLPETFLRNDLLLEPRLPDNVKESAIARTGKLCVHRTEKVRTDDPVSQGNTLSTFLRQSPPVRSAVSLDDTLSSR